MKLKENSKKEISTGQAEWQTKQIDAFPEWEDARIERPSYKATQWDQIQIQIYSEMRNDRIQSKSYPTNYIFAIYMSSRPRSCQLNLGLQEYLLDWILERKTERKNFFFLNTTLLQLQEF